jgi:hypothetical protein
MINIIRNVIMSFDRGMFTSGLGGLLGGLFGNTDEPYDAAMQQYQNYERKSENAYRPYQQAGQGALGDYQKWLQSQQNPSGFVNGLMDHYQESPYAQHLQQQALRAGENYGSATGLNGSSALTEQMQQNAGNIANQDQNQWLQHVLGINTQYGQGQNNLMQGGLGATNSLNNMYNQNAQRMGEAAYNKSASGQNNLWNTIGSGLGLIGSFL